MKHSTAAVVLGVASLCGCNPKRETVTVEPYVAPAAARTIATPPAAPIKPAPARITVSASAALFKDDHLLECVDGTVDFLPSADAAAPDEEKVKEIVARMLIPKKSNPTRLRQECSVQFKDRTPFGVCSDTVEGPGGNGSITITASWYDFRSVFRDDSLMKKCIGDGGSWESVSRDSDLFRMAKLESDQARLMKQVKRYAPDIDE